jgi:hypothetical protein
MHSTVSTNGHGRSAPPDQPQQAQTDPVLQLEALPSGRRFSARDGCRFIRTNLICFGFCDLATGQLCSARDVYAKHGGISAARRPCRRAANQTDSQINNATKAALARHD